LGNTLDKEIVLKSLKREMRDKAILEDVNRLDDMLLALDVLIKETQEEFRAKSIQPYRRQAISTATLAFLTIGIFFVGAIGISWISRSIKRPLMKLTKISSAISQLKGDLTHDLDIEAKDEIGDLAHVFNQSTDIFEPLIGKIFHQGSSNKAPGTSDDYQIIFFQ